MSITVPRASEIVAGNGTLTNDAKRQLKGKLIYYKRCETCIAMEIKQKQTELTNAKTMICSIQAIFAKDKQNRGIL